MKSTTRLFALLALGAIACGSAKPASAQMLYDIVAGQSGTADTTAGFTDGFEFTLSASKTLAKLGMWDEGGNGLNSSHLVGIWDSTGLLLSSTTVTNATSTVEASSNALGRWLFETVTPVALSAGVYRMGVLNSSSQAQDTRRVNVLTTAITGATMSSTSLSVGGNTLQRPTSNLWGPVTGEYGANAMFGASSVPEPSSFALLLAGAAPLGLIARKRLRRKS